MSRVLLVDDERSSRETLAQILGEEGHEVVTAATVEEAARRSDELEPQILITDWRLANGETGSDVSRAVRNKTPDLPVIVITGLPSGQVRADAASFTSHVLGKPIEIEELLHEVSLMLGRV